MSTPLGKYNRQTYGKATVALISLCFLFGVTCEEIARDAYLHIS